MCKSSHPQETSTSIRPPTRRPAARHALHPHLGRAAIPGTHPKPKNYIACRDRRQQLSDGETIPGGVGAVLPLVECETAVFQHRHAGVGQRLFTHNHCSAHEKLTLRCPVSATTPSARCSTGSPPAAPRFVPPITTALRLRRRSEPTAAEADALALPRVRHVRPGREVFGASSSHRAWPGAGHRIMTLAHVRMPAVVSVSLPPGVRDTSLVARLTQGLYRNVE